MLGDFESPAYDVAVFDPEVGLEQFNESFFNNGLMHRCVGIFSESFTLQKFHAQGLDDICIGVIQVGHVHLTCDVVAYPYVVS